MAMDGAKFDEILKTYCSRSHNRDDRVHALIHLL